MHDRLNSFPFPLETDGLKLQRADCGESRHLVSERTAEHNAGTTSLAATRRVNEAGPRKKRKKERLHFFFSLIPQKVVALNQQWHTLNTVKQIVFV